MVNYSSCIVCDPCRHDTNRYKIISQQHINVISCVAAYGIFADVYIKVISYYIWRLAAIY